MRTVPAFILMTLIICTASSVRAEDKCLGCHEQKTRGIVNYWKESRHAKEQVVCVSCHGGDVEANHNRSVVVTSTKCGECHKKALTDHSMSKHGIGLKSGRGCTRKLEISPEQKKTCTFCHDEGSAQPRINTECAMFLAQSPQMQRQGCNACHRVEDRCDTCHSKHGTDTSLARMPETCGTCHMGPDHAQLEMWESSPHGVLYRRAGEAAGPSCATCHMKGGSHNVSTGITAGIPETSMPLKKQERALMLDTCASCHTRSMAGKNLEDADMLEKQSTALLAEARSIVQQLQTEKLLSPTADERPPHPLFGKNFVIGPHMLYENLSTVESLYFRMKQFYYMNAVKGAFHQNPDYTHWYGNAPLKLTLSEIRSEASLLRNIDLIARRLDNISSACTSTDAAADGFKKKLRNLHEMKLKGEISEKDFQELKNSLMKEKGL